MDTITLEEFNNLLEKRIIDFKYEIISNKEREYRVGNTLITSYLDFPMFPIFDEIYRKQVYHHDIIKETVFKNLIKGFIIDLLQYKKIDCEEINNKERIIACSSNGTLVHNDERSCIDLLVNNTGCKVGYYFRGIDREEVKPNEILDLYELDKLIEIDVDDYGSHISKDCFCSKLWFSTLKNFFDSYGESNKLDYYKKQVSNAISFASSIFEYTSMPVLRGKFLNEFKYEIEKEFLSLDIIDLKYYATDVTEDKRNRLLHESTKLATVPFIKDEFVNDRLYKTIVGRSNFAKSFITAEYLYRYFSNNNKIDYTAIGACYVKSIEQLLKIVVYRYKNKLDSNKYYIIAKEKIENFDELCNQGKARIKGKNIREILFVNEYDSFFDNKLSLENYIAFIQHNKVLQFSNKNKCNNNFEKNILEKCLYAFKDDRNKYLHTGYMSKETLNIIRLNTRFLIVMLLGSVEYDLNPYDKFELLDIVDNTFDNTYINLFHGGTKKRFIIEYEGGKEECVILMQDFNSKTEYDDDGYIIKSSLYFVRVKEDMKFIDSLDYAYNPKPEDIIPFDRKHCPIKVWSNTIDKLLLIDNSNN